MTLITQIKWQFVIFARNNLLTMIAGITVVYVIIIYLLKDAGNTDRFITLLIYNDPALVGFVFLGISVILEKDQGILPALFVTPLDPLVFLNAKIISLSTVGYAAALAMVFTAKGMSFNFIHFSVGAFATCVLFSLMGLFIVSFTTEILHFLLRGVPLLVGMSLPLLNYFELADIFILKLFPIQGGLNLMVNSYSGSPNNVEFALGYLSIAVWVPLIYRLTTRIFLKRVARA